MINQQTGEIPLQSFKDWQQLLAQVGNNKIAVLVTAFKVLHPDAPPEDLAIAGGRLAGMAKQSSNDYAYILLKIWQTSPASIVGSHLNYINATLKGHVVAPPPKNPVDKYVSGRYGALVQR